LARLRKSFSGSDYSPTFAEFLKDVDREQRQSQAALTPPEAGHVILTVWKWHEGFDIAHLPAPGLAVDLVTVRGACEPMIALIMAKRTAHWDANEILAFRRCQLTDLADGDICLIQIRPPRARLTKTALAVAEAKPAKRGQGIWLDVLSPAGPVCPATDPALMTIMRAVFRARHT
jgi:hypothetical protein